MKRAAKLVGISGAAVATVAAILRFSEGEAPTVDAITPWPTEPAAEGSGRENHTRTAVAEPEAAAAIDVAAAATPPPEDLAAGEKPHLAFDPSVFLAAGVTQDVAECIVQAVEAHYRLFDVVKAQAAEAATDSGGQ